MPTDFLSSSGQVSGGGVSRDSLGFAYIDLGINLNPMKAGITAALGYLQHYMVKAQSEMDTAMRNIWTIVDTSYNEIMRYEDKIFKLSQMIPRSAKDLAEGLYWIISATIPAAEAMDVLEASAKSATAGLSTTYAAADVLTDIINAYGYKASDATAISDVLFRTVERGKVTYDGLAGSLGAVVGTAAIGNVAFEELAAAVATMTQIGLSADESTTALNRFLLTIVKSSGQAQTEAAKLGLEWNASALEAKGLVGMVQALDEATGGNLETMARIVPEIRALKSVLALARDGAADYTKEVENMYNAQGALERAFLKQKDSIKNSLTFMKNAFYEFSTEMGKALEPAIRGVYDFGTSLFEWLAKLPPATQKVIAATMLLSTTFAALQGPIKKAIASMQAFNLAAMGPGGWIAILGAIAAAIATIVSKHEEWDRQIGITAEKNNELSKSLLTMSQDSGETAKKLGELIKKYEELLPQAADNEEAASELNDAIGKIGEIVPTAITQWDRLGTAIDINIGKAREGVAELMSLELKYAETAGKIASDQLALLKGANAEALAELKSINDKWAKLPGTYFAMGIYGADKYLKSFNDVYKRIDAGEFSTMQDVVNAYLGDNEKALLAVKEMYGKQAEYFLKLPANSTEFREFLNKLNMYDAAFTKDTERQIQLNTTLKDFQEIEIQLKRTQLAAQTLKKSISELTADKKSGDKGDGTVTAIEKIETQSTSAQSELAKLREAIEALFRPFQYGEKTLGGLEAVLARLIDMRSNLQKDGPGMALVGPFLFELDKSIYSTRKEIEDIKKRASDNLLIARIESAKKASDMSVDEIKYYWDVVGGIDYASMTAADLYKVLDFLGELRRSAGDMFEEMGWAGDADKLSTGLSEQISKLKAEEEKSYQAASKTIAEQIVGDEIDAIVARIKKGDVTQAFIDNASARLFMLSDLYGTFFSDLQGDINDTFIELWYAQEDVTDEGLKEQAKLAEEAAKRAQELLQRNLDASMSEIEAAKIAAERLLYDMNEALAKPGTTISEMQAWADVLAMSQEKDFGKYLGAWQMLGDGRKKLEASITKAIQEQVKAQIEGIALASEDYERQAKNIIGMFDAITSGASGTSGEIEGMMGSLRSWLDMAGSGLDVFLDAGEGAGLAGFNLLATAIGKANDELSILEQKLTNVREAEAKALSDKEEKNWLEFVKGGEAAADTALGLFDIKTAADAQLKWWLDNIASVMDKYGSALVQSDTYEKLAELEKDIADELKSRADAKGIADFNAYIQSITPNAADGEARAQAIADTVRSMLEGTDYGPAMAEAHGWLLDGLLAEYAGVQEVADIITKVYADIDKRMDTYYTDLITKSEKAAAEAQAINEARAKETALGQFEAVTNTIMEHVEKFGWNMDWADAWYEQLASILSSPYGSLEEVQTMVQKGLAKIMKAEDDYWADDARRSNELYEQKIERLESKYKRDTEAMMMFVTPFLETDLEGLDVESLEGLAGTGQWLMDTFRDLAEGFGVMPQIFAKYYAALQKIEEITGIIADETYKQKLERLAADYNRQIEIMKQFTDPFLEIDVSELSREELEVFIDYGQAIMDKFRDLAEGAGIMEELFAQWYKAMTRAEELDIQQYERLRKAAAKQVADAYQRFTDGIASVLDKAFKVEGGYDGADDALKDIVGYFSNFAKSYWKSVFATARVRDTTFDKALAMVGEELALKVKDTGDMFVEALSDVGNKLKEMGGSLSDIGDKLIKASDGLGKIFGGIGGLIGDPIVQLFFSVAGFLFSAVEWLNAQVDKFKTKRLYFDTEAGTMVYETPEGRWEWDYKSRSWKQVPKKGKDEEKRAAFQISEISGPMRDTIVAALAPLNTLNSLPTYTNQIVSAIYEVRDLLSGAFASGSLAAGAIQQTFNIQSVNIFAYDEATFSSILADLDKQAQLAALGVGG